MVKINNIEEEPVALYFRRQSGMSGERVGIIRTYLQLLDVRYQIKREQELGYYLQMENGEVVAITKNGKLQWVPRNLFPKTSGYLELLL